MAITAAGTERQRTAVRQLEWLLTHRGGRGWGRGLAGGLAGFRAWLDAEADHDRELLADAPRLVFLTRRLQRQRWRMRQCLDRLMSNRGDDQVDRDLRQLLGQARLYRREMAELLYQAYEVDLGGEH